MIHRRSTRSKVASLSSLSLLSLSTCAFVVPASNPRTNELLSNGASSVRKSLNFGPHIQAATASILDPSIVLSGFNALTAEWPLKASDIDCSGTPDLVTCEGRAIAHEFIRALGKDAINIDAYRSKATNMVHATFLQTVDGVPVANGNLNVNVDMTKREIFSYADSSFSNLALAQKVTTESVGAQLEGWKKKAASWAASGEAVAEQVVFGGSGSDDSPQGDVDLLEEFASPPLVPASSSPSLPKHFQRDPRHGLLSFLALQSPSAAFTDILLATPRSQIIDSFALAPASGSSVSGAADTQHGFTIDNVPTTLEPVKANLRYIHDGKKLRLTWEYEVYTNENQYQAYVAADAGVEGDEETIMVVDWVRDFRPTGGEVLPGIMGFNSAGGVPASETKKNKKVFGGKRTKGVFSSLGRAAVEFITADHSDAALDGAKDVTPAYRVFPWGINAPDEGKRALLSGTLVELDNEASPVGWHTIPSAYAGGKDRYFTDTRGNNVYAQDNPDGGNQFERNYRPDGGKNLTFDFPLGWPKAGTPLEPSTYINASVTELFYTNNEIHDLFYRYGFDEVSGNFQDYNFGRGGAGNDAVQANAQDGSGMNNANFATPPDGSRPRMRMYSWSGTQPYRDGDFEAGIVIHEYAHGISTRLTGGPANSNCLGWGEAGGMGEGWGDHFATMIRMHNINETEFSMGEWASARKGGIRNYPYSRNLTVNLDSYKSLDKPGYWGVHAIGEVWAEFLWEMSLLLVDEHGFTSSLFPPQVNSTDASTFYNDKYTKAKVPKHGNTLAIQLVVDGMKLQPCRPSFQNARDAILQADTVLTGGDNACLIWKAFAKRGLGPASEVTGSTPWGGGVRTEDYAIPKLCKTKKE